MQGEAHEKSTLETYLSTDLPIKTKKEDRLNRGRFSDALAKVILGWRDKPSLVIGLFGDWGSGKSSVKNMVLESLEADGVDHFSIVEFSPWQVSGQDLLSEQFFREIGNAIGKPDGSDDATVKKRVARWKAFSACFSIAATVARSWKATQDPARPSISQYIAGLASGLLNNIASVAKTGAEGIEAEGALNTLSLSELKDRVSGDLSRLRAPILVILDDVDRLTKEEIRLTFQLVKANADFPNLIYLILCQKDIAVNALEEIAPGQGHVFLEKIVQVPFDVPTVNRVQLQSILLNGINELLSHPDLTSRFDVEYWSDLFPELFPFFRNIRDINRFLGSLAFHIELFRNGTTFEVNPVDLIAVEALRVFENSLYTRLADEKEILTYHDRWFRENRREEDSARFQALIACATAERRTSTQKMLAKIFPPAKTTAQSLRTGAGTGASIDAAEQKWFKQLRACSYQAFDRYFQFETPEGDVSQADIDELIAHMSDQKALDSLFARLVERGLLDVMLTRLNSLKESLPLDNASSFLAALFEVNPVHKLYSFLEPSPERNIGGITYWYLNRLGEAERLNVMLDAVTRTMGIGFATRTIATLTSDPHGGERIAPFLTSETDRATLKAACLNRIEEVTARNYEVEPQDFRMLRVWAIWNPTTAHAWVSAYVQTRARLVRFLKSAVQLSGEPPTARPYISLEVIEPMLSREELQARIDELLHDNLNEEETELVNMVHAANMRGPLGPGIDPFDIDSND